MILTAHAGWVGERTRGSSALEDWPDSIVTMTVDKWKATGCTGRGTWQRSAGTSTSRRTNSATTEDTPDSQPRRHRVTEDRPASAQHRGAEGAVLAAVGNEPGENGTAIENALRRAGVTFQ